MSTPGSKMQALAEQLLADARARSAEAVDNPVQAEAMAITALQQAFAMIICENCNSPAAVGGLYTTIMENMRSGLPTLWQVRAADKATRGSPP